MTTEPQLAVSALRLVPSVLFPAFLNKKLQKNGSFWKDIVIYI